MGDRDLATPGRLVKLKCPSCTASHWVVDNDFYIPELRNHLDYDERTYECPQRGSIGQGFQVQKKAPATLTLHAPWYLKSSRAICVPAGEKMRT